MQSLAKFLPFQEKTIQYGIENPYSIYALAMGTGKTLCALETAFRTKSKVVVVAPTYLLQRWKDEVEKFYPGAVVSLLRHKKEYYPLWDTDVAILPYSFVADADIIFEWADLVVIEEAHCIKNIDSKRGLAVHKLVYENSNKRCLLLTGTPIQNRVFEFWSLLTICHYQPNNPNPTDFLDRFPTFVEFANHFSHLKQFDMWNEKRRKTITVRNWNGHKNLEELRQYTEGHYIRFMSKDVLDLPPYSETDVTVDYKDNEKLLSAFMRFQKDGDMASTASDVKSKAAMATAPFTCEYVRDIVSSGEKVVVFTDHIDSCEYLAEKLGVKAIHGQVHADIRYQLSKDFQDGKTNCIVATYGSLSTGVDLQSSACMVFNDLPWVPGVLEQAMYRIIRVGQVRKCNFYFIHGTVQSKYILNTLKEKIETIQAVI